MNKTLVIASLLSVFASTSFAQTPSAPNTPTPAASAKDSNWQKNHPRREQVNSRLNHQNQRIKDEVREGEITKTQAVKLHKKDRQIRQEERDMAGQNGGHITHQEQRTLNQQENKVSTQIGR